jgi:hypothetical protein
MTIMTGAGDRPTMSKGAPGRASPSPQPFRLLKPRLISRMAAAARITPTTSICTSGRPASPFRRKLSQNTMPASTIKMANAGRQPMKVPKMPPIRNAATPAPARAEPSAPNAVACCRPR